MTSSTTPDAYVANTVTREEVGMLLGNKLAASAEDVMVFADNTIDNEMGAFILTCMLIDVEAMATLGLTLVDPRDRKR